MVKCNEIMMKLENLAPVQLAESWDNVGLLVGDAAQNIQNIMVTLDVTPEVVREAIAKNTDLIIAHHPMIFSPLKRVVQDGGTGQMIRSLIKNDIGIYASHTNMDIAFGGLNDILASKLQLEDMKVLDVSAHKKFKKIVVFVPVGHEDAVREAMSREGAGWIGNYSDCTYMTKGIGTFRPGEDTNPYIGEKGAVEKVEEYRVETIIPEDKVKKVIQAMTQAHPYEEVAYDIYPVELEGEPMGLGRIGILPKPLALAEFINSVKGVLDIDHVRYTGKENRMVSKVAVCTGSGGEYISLCVKLGADVYVTGEIKYHQAQLAAEAGLNVIAAGHFETENIMVPFLIDYLKNNFENEGLHIYPSECNQGFFKVK